MQCHELTFARYESEGMETPEGSQLLQTILVLCNGTEHRNVRSLQHVIVLLDVILSQLRTLQEARDHHVTNLLPQTLRDSLRLDRCQDDALAFVRAQVHEALHQSAGKAAGCKVFANNVRLIADAGRGQAADGLAADAESDGRCLQHSILGKLLQCVRDEALDIGCLDAVTIADLQIQEIEQGEGGLLVLDQQWDHLLIRRRHDGSQGSKCERKQRLVLARRETDGGSVELNQHRYDKRAKVVLPADIVLRQAGQQSLQGFQQPIRYQGTLDFVCWLRFVVEWDVAAVHQGKEHGTERHGNVCVLILRCPDVWLEDDGPKVARV
mmetsp:Transcript_17983/g.49880  ORF Transcript_17983/g.49880 Transcript_17983/m.49880 type:complete len:324 (+) Transcript_17983:1545-2516(+)